MNLLEWLALAAKMPDKCYNKIKGLAKIMSDKLETMWSNPTTFAELSKELDNAQSSESGSENAGVALSSAGKLIGELNNVKVLTSASLAQDQAYILSNSNWSSGTTGANITGIGNPLGYATSGGFVTHTTSAGSIGQFWKQATIQPWTTTPTIPYTEQYKSFLGNPTYFMLHKCDSCRNIVPVYNQLTTCSCCGRTKCPMCGNDPFWEGIQEDPVNYGKNAIPTQFLPMVDVDAVMKAGKYLRGHPGVSPYVQTGAGMLPTAEQMNDLLKLMNMCGECIYDAQGD